MLLGYLPILIFKLRIRNKAAHHITEGKAGNFQSFLHRWKYQMPTHTNRTIILEKGMHMNLYGIVFLVRRADGIKETSLDRFSGKFCNGLLQGISLPMNDKQIPVALAQELLVETFLNEYFQAASGQ